MLVSISVWAPALSGCGGGGGGSSSSATSESEAEKAEKERKLAKTYYITVTLFQGLPRPMWVVDEVDRVYTDQLTVEIKGTCSSELYQVQPYLDKDKLGSPVICSNGYWTLAHAFEKDGEYKIVFEPQLADGTVAGSTVTKTTIIDRTPPEPPVILTNKGADIYQDFSKFALDGTVKDDVVSVTSDQTDGKQGFSATKLTWDYSVELYGDSETRKINFYAVDRLKRKSKPATITLYYKITRRLAQQHFTAFFATSTSVTDKGKLKLQSVSGNPWGLKGVNSKSSEDLTHKVHTGLLETAIQARQPRKD